MADESGTPGRRWTRTLLLTAGGLVGVLLLGILLLALLLPRDAIRDIAVEQAAQVLERPLRIGDIGLAFLPHLGAEVTEISIDNDPRLTDAPLVSIDRVVVSVGIWRLLTQREVHVRDVTLEGPRVVIVVDEDGRSSLDGLLREVPDEAGDEADGAAPVGIQLDRFRITDGSLQVDDRQAGVSARIASIEETLGLAVDGTAGRISARGDLALRGVETSVGGTRLGPIDVGLRHDVALDPAADSLGFDLALDVAGIPLMSRGRVGAMGTAPDVSVHLETGRIEIAQLLQRLELPADHPLAKMHASGAATLNARVHAVLDSTAAPAPLDVDARLRLDDIRLDHPDLPKAIDRLSGEVDVTRDSVVIRGLALRAGGTSLDMDARLRGWQTASPVLSQAEVQATVLLDEIAEIVEMPDSTRVGGTVSFRLAASGPVHEPLKMKANGRIALQDVRAAMPGLPVPVQRLDGAVEIAGSRVSIPELGVWLGASEVHLTETSLVDALALLEPGPGRRTPHLRFSLRSPMLDLDELLPPSPPYADDDVVIPAIDLPLVVDGTARFDRIVSGQATFTDLRARTTVRGTRADVEATVTAFRGTVDIGGWLDWTTPDTARYSGRWDLKDVQADAVLSAFTEHGGRLEGTAFTAGTVAGAGNTWREVKRNLTLDASFRAGNGSLNNWVLVQRTSAQVAQAIDLVIPGRGSSAVQRMGLGADRFPYGQLDGGAALAREVLTLKDIGVSASGQDWRVAGTVADAFDTVGALDLSARLTFGEALTRELATAAAEAISPATPVTADEIVQHLEPANRLRVGLPIRGTTVEPDVGTPDLMAPYRQAAEKAVRAKTQQLRRQVEEQAREQADEAADEARSRLRGILKK